MNFKDYCRLRDAEEEVLKRENNVIKIEYTEFSDEYRQIDDVVLEFHNTFNSFDTRLTKLYKWPSAISLLILVLSFCILGFLLLLMSSHSYFQKFGLVIVEWNQLVTLTIIFFTLVVSVTIALSVFLAKRNEQYKIYYDNSIKYENNIIPVEKYTLADYKIAWVRAKFGYENIDYACDMLDENISYKDELDQVFTLTSFFSNFFIKGVFAASATGGLGFIGAYYANKLSADPDIDLIGVPLLINSFVLVFFILSFIAFFYFSFIIIKDVFFETIDFFISSDKVTVVRKKRMSYILHKSRVFRVKMDNRFLGNRKKL